MIPVTSFKGKTVAVFGLGGSGLASCQALKAGGAEVVASDDNAESLAQAAKAGFTTANLRDVSWANFAALVLAPGVPLTHPTPHWTVLAAQRAGVAVIGDIELFCIERKRTAPNAPFVAITGTNGKSTTTALVAHLMREAGHDVQMGGNIGTAILSLEPPRMGRVHVIEMSSYQIDLTPSLDPSVGILLNVTEDHIDRHGTLAHYAAVKERLVASVQKSGTAVIGVDDNWCRAAADRIEQAGTNVIRVSVRNHWRTASMPSATRSCGRMAGPGARSHGSAASARCAASTTRRMQRAPRRGPCAWRQGRGDPEGPAQFSGARAPHGAGGPARRRAVRQRLQGHQCGCGSPRAVVVQRHLLDRRGQAEDRRHHQPQPNSSRASARPT